MPPPGSLFTAAFGRLGPGNVATYAWRAGQVAAFSTSSWKKGPSYVSPRPLPPAAVDRSNRWLGTANGRDFAAGFTSEDSRAHLHGIITEAAKAIDPSDPATLFQSASTYRVATDGPGLFPGLDPQHKYVSVRFGSALLDDAGRALHDEHALRMATSTFCHSSYVIPKWASQLQQTLTWSRLGSRVSFLLWPEKIQKAIGADEIKQAYDSFGLGSRVQLGANTVEALVDVQRTTFEHEGGQGSAQSTIMGTLPDHIFNGYLMWSKGVLPDGRTFTVIAGRGVDVVPFVQSVGNVLGGTTAWALQHDFSDALFRPENRGLVSTTDFANLAFDRQAQAALRAVLTPEQDLLKTSIDMADYVSPFIATLKNTDVVRWLFAERPSVPAGWGDVDPTLLMRSADIDDLTMETVTRPLLGVDYVVADQVSPDFTALRDGTPAPSDPQRYVAQATYAVEKYASDQRTPVTAVTAPPGPEVSDAVVHAVVQTYRLPPETAKALTILGEGVAAQSDFRDPPPPVEEPPALHDDPGTDMTANTGETNIFSGATEDPYGPREADPTPLEPVEPHESGGGSTGGGHGD